jgi:hypothetical protein
MGLEIHHFKWCMAMLFINGRQIQFAPKHDAPETS